VYGRTVFVLNNIMKRLKGKAKGSVVFEMSFDFGATALAQNSLFVSDCFIAREQTPSSMQFVPTVRNDLFPNFYELHFSLFIFVQNHPLFISDCLIARQQSPPSMQLVPTLALSDSGEYMLE
jgi:hypothetical protein